MKKAYAQAQLAAQAGEVPIGAVLVAENGEILAQNHNRVEEQKNACAHAELLVLQEALQNSEDKYLIGSTLYVTLEPCAMCAQAASWARVKAIVFGAFDEKSGGLINGPAVVGHAHHKPQIQGGMMEEECAEILKKFFQARR